MSDRAIPRSFRFMEGFGVHTFRLVNAEGRSTFVKFHWKPKLGMQSVVWNEAVKINGADPDFHRRDLWDAIEQRRLPGVGARPAAVRRRASPTGSTSTCSTRPSSSPRRSLPVRPVGRLVLDRMVDNFFAETEQVAFCTQNVVPGIDFTNDPLLQGRNFSYLDTQLKRLGGPNFTHIPINAPKCPFAHFQQDGHMAMRNPVGRVNYEPNSWTGRRARAARGPRRRLRSRSPRTMDGAKRRLRPETLRRPLQPGPAVLPQPDAGRAEAHRRRVRLRAEQGARRRRSGSGWWPTCATSTKTSPPASPTASAWPRCPSAPSRPPTRSRPRRRRPRSASWPTVPTRFAGRKIGVLVDRRRRSAEVLKALRGRRRRPRAHTSRSSRR